MQANCRAEYLRLMLDGKLNEHLHEIDEECYARVELFIEWMKVGAGIMEKLKATEPMDWVELMNNVRSAAEEIVLTELVYV